MQAIAPPVEWTPPRRSNLLWVIGFLAILFGSDILAVSLVGLLGLFPPHPSSFLMDTLTSVGILVPFVALPILAFSLLVPPRALFGFSPEGVFTWMGFSIRPRFYPWRDVFLQPGRLHLFRRRLPPRTIALDPQQEYRLRLFMRVPPPP